MVTKTLRDAVKICGAKYIAQFYFEISIYMI